MSCRESTSAIREPLVGSAGTAPNFAAISWPKRRWHPEKAARSEGLPPELAKLEARAKRDGPGLALRVFQRGAGGADTATVELLFYSRSGTGFRAPAVAPSELVNLIESGLRDEPPARGVEPLRPELLVCTDGLHDDCCAKFGRPVYRALVDEAAARGSAIQVSECSHLGGHRFAANLLFLPAGDLYGRVEPRDAGPVLRALEAGRIARFRYRGRLGTPEAVQVADTFLAARLPEGCEWEIDDDAAIEGDRVRLRALAREQGRERELTVSCEAQPFTGPGSCGGEVETRRRWVAVELSAGEPIPGPRS